MKYKKVHPSTPIYLSKIREFGKSTEVTTTAQEGTRTSFCTFYIQLLIDMVSNKHFKIRLSPPIFIINGKSFLLQDRQAVAIDPSSSPESWPGFLRPITCKIGTM